LGCCAAYTAIVPVVYGVHGRGAALLAAAVVAPLLGKRIAGNHAPAAWDARTVSHRLLFDRDPEDPA
jgi:hypothetical protein